MSTSLRPMTTGEVLDRTFNLYRQNFQVFVAIGLVPAVMWFLSNSLFLVTTRLQPRSHAGFRPSAILLSAIILIVAFITYFCGIAISHGAVCYAVSAIHLGRTTGFSDSYRRIKGKYLRILNVVISVGIRIFGTALLIVLGVASMALIPAMQGNLSGTVVMGLIWFIGTVAAVFFVVRMSARYALSVPSCVLEDLPAGKAIKRSVALSKGSVGRILAVYILFLIVNMACAFAVAIPFQIAAVAAKSETARLVLALGNNLGSSLVSAVIGPLATIAMTLIYYDERVRKEAFDLNFMMEMLDGPAPQQPNSAAASAGPLTA
jgi:Membrane domain of glycerophosphoryl diester phosphodiesterase